MHGSQRNDQSSDQKPRPGQEAGHSIAKRLAFSLTIAVGLISVLTFLVLYHSAIQAREADLQRNADDSRDYLVGTLGLPLWNYDTSSIETICRTLLQIEHVVGLVVRDDSGAEILALGKGADRNVFRKAGRISHQGEFLGEIEIFFTRRYVQEAEHRLLFSYAITMLFVLLALVPLSQLLVRKFLQRPLDALNRSARPYANGIYDTPMAVLPYLEFQPFSSVLARMGETISAQIKELRVAEARYRNIFENALEGIFQSTPGGSFLSVNPALAKIFCYESPADLMANIRDIGQQLYVNPADWDRIRQELQNRGLVQGVEVEMCRKDGVRLWVSINAQVVCEQDDKDCYFEGSLEDITDRKRAEELLRTLNLELEQRVRGRTAQLQASNQELEAFCYSVSHDLRAPLRHIDGFVELLVSSCGTDLNDQGRHYLDIIAASARQMGVLIDDLLQFSRTGRAELKQEMIDMNQILQEALAPVQESCAGRAIDWDIGELPPVQGDSALLRQVWANLLDNAAKFTRNREAARVEVGCREADGEIVFCVADNGVGFDMQYAGKLFGVFQRLHSQEEFEGTGIGLATVKRIIDRHGGRVWAEAEAERGARFYFTLPSPKEEQHA